MRNYEEIATPALLVDREILYENLLRAQSIADKNGVKLRPHTKTHKSPEVARMQLEAGACGIAVAKVAEAEIMAASGIQDIFIANEPVGADKIRRIRKLSDEGVLVSFGVDCLDHIKMVEEVFQMSNKPARILIEVEVGENRSGVVDKQAFRDLLRFILACQHIRLLGVFSHDGISYQAATREEARQIGVSAQKRTLEMAEVMRAEGIEPQVISIGSTTSILLGCKILPGITEIRIGTYVYMDESQAHAIGDENYSTCAATVLLSVMSKPTTKRVVLDGGAKSLTMQKRSVGLTANNGFGRLKHFTAHILRMYDEHAILEDEALNRAVAIGQKIEVIPNHICPVVNLYKKFYLVEKGEIIAEYPVSCAQATE